MSLNARFRIAIVALATLIVVAMSCLYVQGFLKASFQRTDQIATSLAENLQSGISSRLNALERRPASIEEAKNLWVNAVEHDEGIHGALSRTTAAWPQIAEIELTDTNGRILASSRDGRVGRQHLAAARFDKWKEMPLLSNVRRVFFRSEDTELVRALGVPGQPIIQIHLVLSPVFLRNLLLPELERLWLLSMVALLASVAVALVLPSLIMNPLLRLSERIDRMTDTPGAPAVLPVRESKEFAAVHSKLNLLGQQVAGAREDVTEMRSNVAQLLEQLKDAVLLFDPAGKLVVAGPAVRHVLGCDPETLIGRLATDVFPLDTPLGYLVAQALEKREGVRDRLVSIATPDSERLILASVEPIARRAAAAVAGGAFTPQPMGILVTLRDAETRGQIEEQLGIADRLSAMSQLTRGVAHEIKNPLNAITVHLEVLNQRIGADEAPELNVIRAEIARLNRIVKTFLDFNRPVDLRLRRIDLNEMVSEIAKLIGPEASAHDVTVVSELFGRPVWIDADRDLLKQAFLNVVMNALEAMPDGGRLTVSCSLGGGVCRVGISDTGPGIAPEIRDKIFNLYFTTKGNGSGIGLAMAYRFMQLHDGRMTFSSESGQGATFIFELPEAESLPLDESRRLARRV
jgi:signal transduction histidine kinase